MEMDIEAAVLSDLSFSEHEISRSISVYQFSASNLTQHFGQAIHSYFRFLKFIILLNLTVFFVCLIQIVAFTCSLGSTTNADAIISSILLFTMTNHFAIIVIVILLLHFICHGAYIYQIKKDKYEHPHTGQLSISTPECLNHNKDCLSECLALRKRFSKSTIYFMRFMIFLVFVGLCILYYFCELWLLGVTEEAETDSNAESIDTALGAALINSFAGVPTLMSSFLMLVDVLWRLLFALLSGCEGHKYYTTSRTIDFIRLYFSRITMFLIFAYVHQTIYYYLPLMLRIERTYSQMLNLLLLNIFGSPILDLLWNRLYRCCHSLRSSRNNKCNWNCTCCCCCCDSDSLLFNIPEHYTRVFYNQFLINQVIVFMPIASLIGCLGGLLQYWIEKYKLLKVSRKPEKSDSHYLKLIFIFSLCNTSALFINLIF